MIGEALIGKYTGGRMRPTRAEIGQLAYHLYVTRGRRDGHDAEDWLTAEQELVHHYRSAINIDGSAIHINGRSRGEETT